MARRVGLSFVGGVESTVSIRIFTPKVLRSIGLVGVLQLTTKQGTHFDVHALNGRSS